LETAPDFFPYFAAAAPVMDADPSIHCVSAWNDQGQMGRASNSTAVYRTDVMPGLGWMMPAHIGLEFLPKWPRSGWDEILRDQRHIHGRQCIFPEVARTHTFGRIGASEGVGYDDHLAVMVLNKNPVDWSQVVSVACLLTLDACMHAWTVR
jgi:alpha-1,3-mannosyl-glycoprotein beta-1,2-N-acetylglucosaminyltransferase